MKIAVASGKGGTGKTTVATSLALSLAEGMSGIPTFPPSAFLDCDSERVPVFRRGRAACGGLVPRILRRRRSK
jgi:hypothetical protein